MFAFTAGRRWTDSALAQMSATSPELELPPLFPSFFWRFLYDFF
jgi:hypothetical protein